ncbi:hypothetical protein RM780_15550 [Streptomyces sp. DSM 44917]|uniref:PE-PGRS family protein n=1 Tax=Streptomyces boetiae TaxID=3075541 RepID=A0ABU2L9W8_9ACTN|nr:hypothetical protein [Streptomyces sp. DSM 44917]MDT0308365.1 hypothetical protein [Streptomyces sp. DSM 44917]
MRTLMPYPTLAGEVTFSVVAARVDGRGLPLEMISLPDRVVALHQVERRAWEEARLEVQARLPQAETASSPWRDLMCAVVVAEGATNSRTVTRLRHVRDGDWAGTVTLSRAAHRGRAELSVCAVATVDGVPGRIIGASDENWIVDLAAQRPVRQRELHISEIDFRSPEADWLHPFKDAPWLVETSGDMPTVHLNTGFDGIEQLLNAAAGPAEKAVRDMLAAQIAADAWTAMFHAAVSDLEVEEDGTPQWPSGWRDSVLRGMLPDVLPESSPADALLEIHARRSEGTGWNELQPRIQYAAARRARVAKHLGSAIRTLDRSAQGEAT